MLPDHHVCQKDECCTLSLNAFRGLMYTELLELFRTFTIQRRKSQLELRIVIMTLGDLKLNAISPLLLKNVMNCWKRQQVPPYVFFSA